jgi:hypothetical protein
MMDDPSGGKYIIASICQEVKDISGCFSSLKFSFVGRLTNEAADRERERERERCTRGAKHAS